MGSEFLGFQRRRSRWISILPGSVIVIYQGDFSTHRSCSDSYRFCHLACSHPRGSVSLDSRSPAAPYESSSLATARNAAVLQRTAEPGPSWCLYCTLKHLPFEARPVGVCASRQRDSDGSSHFLFYLHPLLRRSRLSEADPSPALWAAPFSKGARFMWVESLECMDNHAAEPRLTVPLFKGSSPAEDC